MRLLEVCVYTCLAANNSTNPNANGTNTLVTIVSCKEMKKKSVTFCCNDMYVVIYGNVPCKCYSRPGRWNRRRWRRVASWVHLLAMFVYKPCSTENI